MLGKIDTADRPLSRDAARALALLARARERPVTLAELSEHGVRSPGHAVYELQLAGYDIDRATAGNGAHLPGYRLAGRAVG